MRFDALHVHVFVHVRFEGLITTRDVAEEENEVRRLGIRAGFCVCREMETVWCDVVR